VPIPRTKYKRSNSLFCHKHCAHLWTRVAAIVTASCAVSYRQFRYPPPHQSNSRCGRGCPGPAGTRTPVNSPGCRKSLRCKPALMAACSTVPMEVDGKCIIPLVIHPIRHANAPCGLALDALLGGGFACRALSQVSLVSLSGLHVHIKYDSLGCSSRRPAIAFT